MADDSISTLYRKPCPSCARQYARDSRACPFCGYVEGASGEAEGDQERLFGEYLIARCQQSHNEVERLRREVLLHPEDRNREHLLALAEAEDQAFEQDLKSYQEGQCHHEPEPAHLMVETAAMPELTAEPAPLQHHREPEPPRRAIADKECPVCTATVPREVERCACGYIFGAEFGADVMQLSACPHCTAPVQVGVTRCGCGYPLAVGPAVSGIPGLSKR